MVIDLSEEFLADADKRIDHLHEQLKRGDSESFGATAHALKGASLTFGAKTFSSLCKDMEMIGKSGNLDGAQEKLAETQAEYARVRAELPRILQDMLP